MAERINFTKQTLETLVGDHDGTRRTVYDVKQAGLAMELRSAGSASFYLYKRIQGRPSKIRLGGFPETTIEHARKQCAKLIGQIASGGNPAAERRAARVEHTFGALFDWWVESHAKSHRRTWREDERQFNKHLAHLRTRRLSSVSRSEVQALHAKLGRESGKVTANRVIALIRALFNKADAIGYCGSNPADRIQRFAEPSRDRFLQPDEFPAFWRSLSHEPQLFQDFFTVAAEF